MRVWSALFALGLTCLGSGSAWAVDFNHYHSQAQIAQLLRDFAAQNPALVSFHVLGASEQGREIAYVVVGTDDSLPAIYLNGTHHGNEPSSTEAALGVVDYLIKHQNDAPVQALLARYRIFVQPLVSPDGHAANTREEPHGRDPNRDYAYPQRSDADSFRIGFIRLVKSLVDQEQFRAAVAYHSGMEGVLWPWCYTGDRAPDRDLFYTLSKRAADAMGMRYFVQSYDDYESEGEFIDYVYERHHTLGVTFEVSEAARPSEGSLAGIVDRAVRGTLAFMLAVQAADHGTLALEQAPPPALQFLNQAAVLRGAKVE